MKIAVILTLSSITLGILHANPANGVDKGGINLETKSKVVKDTYSPDAVGTSLYFPISETISWTPLSVNEIKCEHRSRTPILLGSYQIKGKLPILHSSYTIEGYLCASVVLTTKCEKGFFGGTTVTYIESHDKVDIIRCRTELENYLTGSLTTENLPAPDRSWMSTNHNTKNIYHIIHKQVMYDPYTNTMKSEIFPNGECKDHYCRTTDQSKIWLPDQLHRPICIEDHLDTALFYIKPYKSASPEFWSPDINIPTQDSVCTMDYCGMGGLRFADGSWIGIDSKDIPKNDSTIGEFFFVMKDCPVGSEIKMHEKHYTEHLAEMTILEKFFYKECLSTKEKLDLGEHISRIELQSLAPVSPGWHRVYRLINGSLEMGMSEYKEGTITSPMKEDPIIFRTTDGRFIKWNYWTHDSRQNIFDGPNGLFIHNGRIVSVSSDIKEYQKSLRLSIKLNIGVKRVGYYEKHEVNNTESYIFQENHDAALSDVVGNWWVNVWNTIVRYFLYITGIVVLIIGLLLVIRCVNLKRMKKNSPKAYYNPDARTVKLIT